MGLAMHRLTGELKRALGKQGDYRGSTGRCTFRPPAGRYCLCFYRPIFKLFDGD